MGLTKRIIIILSVSIAFLAIYLNISIFSLWYHIHLEVQSFESHFWAFNTFNAIILLFLYIIIVEILDKYHSFRQLVEGVRWRHLRTIEPFKILISFGVAIITVPLIILIYAFFLINSTISSLFNWTLITTFIGFGLVLIGIYLLIRKK